MKNNNETIYDILKTPVENLKNNQIEFLNKVLDFAEEKRKKPLHLIGSILTFGGVTAGTIAMMCLPVSFVTVALACGGILASAFSVRWIKHALRMADYKKLNTNKFSFEEFEDEKGIEQIEAKLDAHLTYEAETFMQELNNNNPYPVVTKNNSAAKTNEVEETNEVSNEQ